MTFQTPAARMSAQPHDWIRWAPAGAGRDPGMWRAGVGPRHVHCGVMRQLLMEEALFGCITEGTAAQQPAGGGQHGGPSWGRAPHPAMPAWPDALAQQPQSKHAQVSCMVGGRLSASGWPPSALRKLVVESYRRLILSVDAALGRRSMPVSAVQASSRCWGTIWSSTWAWRYRAWSPGSSNRQQPTVTAQQAAPLGSAAPSATACCRASRSSPAERHSSQAQCPIRRVPALQLSLARTLAPGAGQTVTPS